MISFNDLEHTRQAYQQKSQAISKKRWKAVLITCSIAFPIEIIFLLLGLTKLPTLNARHFAVLAAPVAIALLFEFLFIYIIVLIATHKDSAVLINEYANYKRAYKAYFIDRQLAKLFTNLHYDHTRGLDVNLLEASKLIYTGDIYRSNDLVAAKYKNTNFMQADVEVIRKDETRDKDGNKHTDYVTVFKGRYLIFEFPKKFASKMIVSSGGGNGLGYTNPKTGRGLSRIETESPDFNKRFLVYAEDGFEAFYILNPDFINKLEQLGEKYQNALSLYFSDNKLYVGLNDHNDAFEPPSNIAEPLNEKTETAKVTKDMKLITDLVDNLKLSK